VLGRVVVRLPAEAFIEARQDRVQVDPEEGEQLGIAGLGAGQDALGDQPVEPGPDGVQVQTVRAQHPGGQVVALDEQAEEQMLGAEVVLVAALGLLSGKVGTMPAASVNRTIWLPPGPGPAARAMFLVDGLLGDSQPAGDVLPGPPLGPGVVDLQGLQGLDQAAEGGHRPQAELGVLAAGGGGERGR
jgi:hypothetical protein